MNATYVWDVRDAWCSLCEAARPTAVKNIQLFTNGHLAVQALSERTYVRTVKTELLVHTNPSGKSVPFVYEQRSTAGIDDSIS